ncbi:hypothetical protein K493DRAFT_305633 [Basidiobolus meristosporus CBS 931.73]|uniref:DNA-directed RNA polymerase III subunit n=1 Tax=Basidiobolus meristosporus CBS 931.73 TaxID=1314790 RepID=A0A1Y1XV14_9FUNG|nr:hypothetical protein K493DRAFT_305633 [Basidiobolus meristosporus CBS 931.73]|eukprot:ORX89590.1 hypothetical protein K493DRAFT_305633 [Basidiobolus meristosporus CBS 931.73]
MSRGGRGRGRGGGPGRAGPPMSGLQSEVQGMVFFPAEPLEIFPEIDLPIPKSITYEEREALKLLREYKKSLKESPFYLELPPPPKDIERYSDRYQHRSTSKEHLSSVIADLSFFPEELHSAVDKTKTVKKPKKVNFNVDLEALNSLEKEEQDDGKVRPMLHFSNEAIHSYSCLAGKQNADEEEGAEGEDNEEAYDEEEDFEEETDYVDSYFDNGEGDEYDDDDGIFSSCHLIVPELSNETLIVDGGAVF